MLYKKNQAKELDRELFKNPTSEYRAAPFWAWNCELDEKELLWQIEQLRQMGFGGFHMHTRSGMATKYLSDDFMQLIKSCTEKAKEEKMLAWLYDEDRWPSGAAGGYVTKTPKYRQRRLFFTMKKRESVQAKDTAVEQGTTYLLGIYDVILDSRGELAEYHRIENEKDAKGNVWYAYVEVHSSFLKSPGWYNGGTYVDTLNKAALESFVQITHEKYKAAVGEEFDATVPAIFTDEPQFSYYWNLPAPQTRTDATLPWTPDMDDTFLAAYGYDIREKLPELFWELPEGKVSASRYHFHDHVCERFASAFADTCGKWCEKNGISFTGHLYGEYTLLGQTRSSGEAMRSYRSFQLPGIDMLFNSTEYSTAKQAQSAAHQYGREGVMSELYGVTNWDFDFRGHKFQGDWQAALGITVRVPHLSWVSMKGTGKRDYPASMNYQVPWYKEYPYIEDHYARLNTVLTRGKACVNVGVIHPIESYWLHFGPEESTASIRGQMDEKFDNIVKWLLFDTVDFDFICESTLPDLCGKIGQKLTVGEMAYSTIIVPDCETLRKTTVDILRKFMEAGGNVIFAGEAPKYMDAVPSSEPRLLYERAVKVPFDRYAIVNALSRERLVEIKDAQGKNPEQFIYQMREDGECYHLFIANARPRTERFCNGTQGPTHAVIKIKGEFVPELMNTLSGEVETVNFVTQSGVTTVFYDFYENDSLLLTLRPGSGCNQQIAADCAQKELGTIDFRSKVQYIRHEDNVCLMDLAEYVLNDGAYENMEEILRIDGILRKKFGWPLATGQDMQPWALEKEEVTNFVTLRYRVKSEEAFENICLCAEEIEGLELNGENIALKEAGYFVDKSIKKYTLPRLRVGENVITVKVPFSKRESLEACYLTGDFNVVLEGCEKTLVKASDSIGFGDIGAQGMPFYGGNITYRVKINVPEACDLRINIAQYKGALTRVTMDGQDMGNIVFAPYDLEIENVAGGEHTVEFTLFGNRHNTFGALHNCGPSIYYGQHYWYSTGNSWCYEYNIKKTGILKSPVITMVEKNPPRVFR